MASYVKFPHNFRIGDLVRYKHSPEMIGVVIETYDRSANAREDVILVWWQVPWRRPGEYNLRAKNKWRVPPDWIERVRPS